MIEKSYKHFFSAKTECEECDGMIDHEKGEITSPNYPFDYGPDLKCTHVIEAPKDHVIVTRIIDFDVRKII